ncbi:Vesicle-fusing ATPase [Scale drop disease virus]|uniref:Vesicle-fusing ATPase n=1 Tax=Scale drop disease virus TaxID=1697349 RepID=A0A7D5YV57_9VIRU|nr:Vesicle-fusing ATPase [Scale drop disease virus]QXJ13616.1 ORF026R [Scale drop disease virus]UNH60757.1 Vesicle-fusing ATPase [Scale drop disease virus]
MHTLTIVRCSSNDLSLTNCAIVSDLLSDVGAYIVIEHSNVSYVLKTIKHCNIAQTEIALGKAQRKWANIAIGSEVVIKNYSIDNLQVIQTIDIDVNKIDSSCYNASQLKQLFLTQFHNYIFVKDQSVLLKVADVIFTLRVVNLDCEIGMLTTDVTTVTFVSEGLLPNWNVKDMQIGGLSKEFSEIFRRAFVSRVFSADVIKQLGCKHVRGLLLYGPPGCGKTLIARELSKLLTKQPPKIVNGPEILNKYVGQSEENVRRLFADAEEEQKRLGRKSSLHIIILDELDAICKQRGSGVNGVHDTVVNQLLSKLDGVNQLNNILVIGMTNRLELIDSALLRPGRLEIKIEINLPDECGRVEILNIHTSTMRQNNLLNDDVDLEEIAAATKNYSGAELEGLVRAAQSIAMSRCVDMESVTPSTHATLNVTRADFIYSMTHDIKATYCADTMSITQRYIANGIVHWSDTITDILATGNKMSTCVKTSTRIPFATLLVKGLSGTGKTALAAQIAINCSYPFIKICAPDHALCMSEHETSIMLRNCFYDAYKSQLSCIVIDDIDRLLHYTPIGPRFSNSILQTLLVLLKTRPKHKLFVICTSTYATTDLLDHSFDKIIETPLISTQQQLDKALALLDAKPTQLTIENGLGIKSLISQLELG